MEYALDGYCGLYCGACPNLLGTRSGTETNACFGCRTETTPEWCRSCGLKRCAREKGLAFCYQCAQYPCAELEAFKTSIEYPYHREVYGYMEVIRDEGKDAWLEKMKARWSCPACRREASWWELSCRDCGTALDGYAKP